MERISLDKKSPDFQLLFLFDFFSTHAISKWGCSRFKFFPKFDSFFRSRLGNFVDSFYQKKLVHGLTQENVCLDKKDDGNFSRDDVKIVMGKLGLFCNSESEQLPGCFSSKEFSEIFEEKEPSLEELKEAFNVFDVNRDGFIDERELQRVLCLLGLKEGSNLENCQQMIRNFDENRDSRIDFTEFIKFMETNLS